MFDYEDYVRHRTTLSGQKFSAWALAVGERPRSGQDSPRRARRGALPDVDFDRAVCRRVAAEGCGPMREMVAWGRMRPSSSVANCAV